MRVQISSVEGTSYRRGRFTAQVTILRGEGSGQRSETRHIIFEKGVWVGYNPDPTAISRRNVATERFTTAASEVEVLESKLRIYQEAESREMTMKERLFLHLMGLSPEEVRELLPKLTAVCEQRIRRAKEVLTAADRFLTEIRERYPLTVEFYGAGLESLAGERGHRVA